MQCASYIPVYYHAKDLNIGASGFTWHLFNGNANYGEETGYNISLPPCTMDQYLGYDKDMLRQKIQNHEATFRYQVQELHRLYRRQRELMNEVRMREVFAQRLLTQTSESIHSLSQPPSDISQTMSHATSWLLGDCSHTKLSELTAENIRRPTNFVAENFQEQTTTSPGQLVRQSHYNEVKFLSSRSKGSEKRTLDLEIPADVYHHDERKQFEEGNLSEAPEVTSNTPEPNIQPARDSEIGCVKTGVLSSFNLNARKTNCFIDLNEPIQLESLPSISTGPSETYTCHMELMHNDPCVSVQAIPESVVPKYSRLSNCDDSPDHMKLSVAFDLNSMPISCFSETEMTIENLCTINKETRVVVDCSSAHDHAMRNGKCVQHNPVMHTEVDDKFLKTKTYIDLNAGVVFEPSPPLSSTIVQIKSAGDTDLEGPLSPENEECSPPRGRSEDIQVETPPVLSEQCEGELSVELDMIAARTLFMISSYEFQKYMKAEISEPLRNSRNCLCWFAEIVSSTGDDLENEAMKLQNDATNKGHGELRSDGIYDFGAITLKVSEESSPNLSHADKNEKETGTFWSGNHHTRGTRQHKDFETEVLSSIASLSRDIHATEEFLETGSLRRNAGRKTCAKPRKYSKLSPPDVGEKSMSSILKQPATRSKHGILQGWGKMRKRQGGYRRRARKFVVIG